MKRAIQPTVRRSANVRALADDDAASSAVVFTIAGLTITFVGLLAWFVGGVVLMWLASLGLGAIFGLAGFIMVCLVIFLLIKRGG